MSVWLACVFCFTLGTTVGAGGVYLLVRRQLRQVRELVARRASYMEELDEETVRGWAGLGPRR